MFLTFFLVAVISGCGFFLFTPSASAESQISLTQNANDYTIENEYYKAIIPTDTGSDKGKGLVRYLYVKKSNGNWSNNLILENTFDYGLGFLEGTGTATNNRPVGLQGADNVITVIENTSSRIKIRVTKSLYGTDFSEIWTFWAKKPYFRSAASAVVTDANGYLTNQFQFAWMINDDLTASWYGTNKNGNATQVTKTEFQPIHSPNLGKYPWINWQFTNEGVSLGMVFTDIYDPLGTLAETGDYPYEYQMNFELGSGILSSPVKNGTRREVTTIYYTNDHAAYAEIDAFATNSYQGASTIPAENPLIQAAQYLTNPYAQNTGVGSALVSSPFFMVRQNTQNRHIAIERTQYETSIYAPLYKNHSAIHDGSYDYVDQLIYSLNYSDDSQTYIYGTISSADASNSSSITSLQNNATSSNSKLAYSTLFKTWNDSDKLQLTGSASNASSSAAVKDIYINFDAPSWSGNFSEAGNTASSTSVTSSLITNDSLWTNYTLYSYDNGSTLIYSDKQEVVPSLTVSAPLSDGQYVVMAYVLHRPEGAITYRYSTDNSTWNSFIVAQAGSSGIEVVNLGVLNISNGVFYIDDDNSLSGINSWAGWDRVAFYPITVNLGSNVYDVRIYDDIYGEMGIGVKINSPTDNVSIISNTDLRVYLYQQPSAQTLTTFNYPFDIELYPHQGWLSDQSGFTSLHSQADLSYIDHSFYVPESTVHSGRTNTIYSNGTVTYSSDPYNDTTKVNLTVTPSTNSVDIAVDDWNTTSTYYKKWTESAASPTITTAHTIGDLRVGQYYQVKVGGTVLQTLQANGSGQISFTYSGGYSTKTFEVEEIPTVPTIKSPTVLSSTAIRWNFTDNADNETGFRVYTNADVLATSSATANLTYLDETGLSENTQYTRYAKAYNSYGESASSSATSTYTLADTPTNLIGLSQGEGIVFSVDTLPNATSGLSGYYFYRNNANSGWINTNTWTDTNTDCSDHTYYVKYRNGDGTQTSITSFDLYSIGICKSGGVIWTPPVTEEPITPTPTSPTSLPAPLTQGSLVKSPDSDKVYLITNNQRLWIPDAQTFIDSGYQWLSIQVVSTIDLTTKPTADLIKTNDDPAVYALINNQRHHIPNPEIFTNYNYQWTDIITVNQSELNGYTPAILFKINNNPDVYYLDNNQRHYIVSAQIFNQHNWQWEDIVEVSQQELEYYQEGTTVSE